MTRTREAQTAAEINGAVHHTLNRQRWLPAAGALLLVGLGPACSRPHPPLQTAALSAPTSAAETTALPAPVDQATATEPVAPPPEIDVSAMDQSIDPCRDLYRYSCGGWLQNTIIPADRPAWSRSFSTITERNLDLLRQLLTTAATGSSAAPDPDTRKLGDFYAACMDEGQAETASRRTLDQIIARINDVTAGGAIDGAKFAALLAELQRKGIDVFFQIGSQQDFRDATRVITAIDQGGLGLPDRDYYMAPDSRSATVRQDYQAFLAQLFRLTGTSIADARNQAEAAFQLETALAAASLSRTDRRDPMAVYHTMDRAGLVSLAPHFDWKDYLRALGHPEIDFLNVAVPRFFQTVDQIMTTAPRAQLRAYLVARTIDQSAPALGAAFVDASFNFTAHSFGGQSVILPRWKRCVNAVEAGMGQALGRAYVAARFSASGKTHAETIVEGVEAAMRQVLQTVPWMDDSTRAEARNKLAALANQVGYPARWRDYHALAVSRASDLANRMAAATFEMDRQLAKIGKPVDRTDWEMDPETANAYYDPSQNQLVLPAGILQPPLFWQQQDAPALAFGGIGVVAGHELTHAFDDQGRKFDAQGNLRDWWSPDVKRAFDDRVACVVSQYDAYTVGDRHVQGKLTAGEDIADMGGLRLAYDAFIARGAPPVPASGKPAGLQPSQRFFVAFAQSWCTKRRDPYAQLLVTIDEHAPPEDRVNGAAADLPAFAEAFSCPAAAPLAPAHRCQIW